MAGKKKKDDLGFLKKMPWITKDWYLDLTKFPIDSTLEQALSTEEGKFRSACMTLASMCGQRPEAGIFLFGLLTFYRDDMVRKQTIVEALGQFQTEKTAHVLFEELDRIESSDTTRVYINAILTAISRFPPTFVEPGLTRLIEDKRWSYRMKRKFQAILDGVDWRYF